MKEQEKKPQIGQIVLNALDTLDEELIDALAKNPRRSARELAREIHSSPSTVLKRLSNLEKSGIIRGYCVERDWEKLGYDFMAMIEVTIRKGALIEVQKKIAQLPGVVSVYDVTGQADSLVLARCKNRRDFSYLVKKILAMEQVERTNTHVILNTIKENYRISV